MLDAIKCPDKRLLEQMIGGFPIVGTVERSCRWPSIEGVTPEVTVAELLKNAHRTRSKIISK
eukprot:4763070-Amphidinium_carterae.1